MYTALDKCKEPHKIEHTEEKFNGFNLPRASLGFLNRESVKLMDSL